MPKQRGGTGPLGMLLMAGEVGDQLGRSKNYRRMGAKGATGHYFDPLRADRMRRIRGGGGEYKSLQGYFSPSQWKNFLKWSHTGKKYAGVYKGGGLGSLFKAIIKPASKALGKKVVKMAGKKAAKKAAKAAVKKGTKKAVKKAGKSVAKKALKKGTGRFAKKALKTVGTTAGTAAATGLITAGIGSAIKGNGGSPPTTASLTPKAAIPVSTQKKKKRKRVA